MKATREQHFDASTRARILRVAKSVFAAKGFAGSRMEDIARVSGVNKAMIHYYFHSKSELYTVVLLDIFSPDKLGPIQANFTAEGLSPSVQLRLLVYTITQYHLRNPDTESYRIMNWEMAEGGDTLRNLAQSVFTPKIMMATEIIERGIRSGDFECEHPSLLLWNIVSMALFYVLHKDVYSMTSIYDKLYGISPETFGEFITGLVFKGISPAGRPVRIPPIPDCLKESVDAQLNSVFVKFTEEENAWKTILRN